MWDVCCQPCTAPRTAPLWMQPRASPAKFPTFQSLEEAKESKAMEIMKGMALYTDIITVPTTTP